MAYRWPGNVRELKNVVERLAVRAPGEDIQARDLPEECREIRPRGDRQSAADGSRAGRMSRAIWSIA